MMTHFIFRLNSIDIKYQVWKLGVVFTDNVSPTTPPPHPLRTLVNCDNRSLFALSTLLTEMDKDLGLASCKCLCSHVVQKSRQCVPLCVWVKYIYSFTTNMLSS